MANPEHLAKLKEGVAVWNQWREENQGLRPDLCGVVLNAFNLSGANLSEANLSEADLSRCDMSESDLSGVYLYMSNLSQANLYQALLVDADFRLVNFESANLADSRLEWTNLTGANLAYANLSGAFVGLTVFADLDLSTVYGLESVKHATYSTIGIDTLYRSQGKIPEIFLRNCGVPDQMIEYAISLTNTPIQYYSCFISYSHKDEEFAQRLYADLQAHNVRCWLASEDMKIGDKIRPTIDKSIRIHDKLLLILSEHSVESEWVGDEAEHALDLERERKKGVLFPVRLDEAVMDSKTGWASNVRRQRYIGNFTNWKEHDAYKAAFDRLLRDLKAV